MFASFDNIIFAKDNDKNYIAKYFDKNIFAKTSLKLLIATDDALRGIINRRPVVTIQTH